MQQRTVLPRLSGSIVSVMRGPVDFFAVHDMMLLVMIKAISGKLVCGFATALIISLALFIFSSRSSKRIISSTLEIVEYDLASSFLIINADRDAYQSNLAILLILELIDVALEEGREPEMTLVDESVSVISDNRDQVRERFDRFYSLNADYLIDESSLAVVDSFNQYYAEWSDMTDRIIQDIRSADRLGHARAWNTYYEGGYRDVFSVMRESLDFLTEWVEASAARRTTAVIENSARNSRFLIAVLTALSVGLGIICWSLIIAIRRPLFRLQNLLGVVSDSGDLTQRFPISGACEVSRVGEAFNGFINILSEIIGSIHLETRNLAGVRGRISRSAKASGDAVQVIETVGGKINILSSELKEAFKTFTSSVKAIEIKVSGLDDQVLEQVGIVEESTAAVQQMISSVGNAAKVSRNNAQASHKLLDAAGDGRERLLDLVKAVESTSMRVSSVIKMTDIITDIAETTNLLAMNAAIEAAHAGDSGRGFAVVADEIRKLAETTSNQSGSIADTLAAVVEDVRRAVEYSGETQSGYESIYGTIEDVGNAFEEIVTNMSELQVGGRQILDSMESLRSSSASVRDGSGEIKTETALLTSGIESIQRDADDAALAARDLKDKQMKVSGLLIEMNSAADDLTASSNQLVNKIDNFTIDK